MLLLVAHSRLVFLLPYHRWSSLMCSRPSFLVYEPRCPGLVLERNEVIALFNTLERLAAAVEVVRDLSLQLR